jgi:hypothetical protein
MNDNPMNSTKTHGMGWTRYLMMAQLQNNTQITHETDMNFVCSLAIYRRVVGCAAPRGHSMATWDHRWLKSEEMGYNPVSGASHSRGCTIVTRQRKKILGTLLEVPRNKDSGLILGPLYHILTQHGAPDLIE